MPGSALKLVASSKFLQYFGFISFKVANLQKRLAMGDYSPAHDAMQEIHSKLESRKGLESRARYFSWLNAIMTAAPFVAVLVIFTVG